MGCDIHPYCEKLVDGKWEFVLTNIFDWRSYSIFGFLGDVRNYSCCEPLSKNRGLPEDVSEYVKKIRYEDDQCHSTSFLTLKELLDFDYDKTFWNRRIYRGNSGACIAEPGEGEIVSYREFLGDGFFLELEKMKAFGSPEEVRLVFWFDN